MTFGRVVYTRGAEIFAIGRKEVERFAREGVDLSDLEGLRVVCGHGVVVTTYRNSNFSDLRPARRRRGRRNR